MLYAGEFLDFGSSSADVVVVLSLNQTAGNFILFNFFFFFTIRPFSSAFTENAGQFSALWNTASSIASPFFHGLRLLSTPFPNNFPHHTHIYTSYTVDLKAECVFLPHWVQRLLSGHKQQDNTHTLPIHAPTHTHIHSHACTRKCMCTHTRKCTCTHMPAHSHTE